MKLRTEIYKILAEWGVLDADNINKNTPGLGGQDWKSDWIVDRLCEDLYHILPYDPYEVEDENLLHTTVFDSEEKYKENCVEKNGQLNKRMKILAKRSNSLCDDVKNLDIINRQKTIVEGTAKVNNLIQNVYDTFEDADGAKNASLKELISILCMEYEIVDEIFPYLTGKTPKDYHIERLQFWEELANNLKASKNQDNKFNFSNVSKEIEALSKAKAGGTMGQGE